LSSVGVHAQSRKKLGEIIVILLTYVAFLFMGIYSGQTTMNVEIVDPVDGTQLHYSPVTLVARTSILGAPISNATASFRILYSRSDFLTYDSITDKDGIARIILPAHPGNYTWQVTARKEGYPTIRSPWSSFTLKLSLIVDTIFPTTFDAAASPVKFRASVTDTGGNPIESANVTFYLDSRRLGWNLTKANGIASLSSPVPSGRHFWFASARKNHEGGISELMLIFVVGQPTSTAPSGLNGLPVLHISAAMFDQLTLPRILGVVPDSCHDPTRMGRSSALDAQLACENVRVFYAPSLAMILRSNGPPPEIDPPDLVSAKIVGTRITAFWMWN